MTEQQEQGLPRRLDEADFDLSMQISPRSRQPGGNEDLRSLLVHRLTDTTKAVGRLSLRGGSISFFCEGCRRWSRVKEFPLEFDCSCGRSYATEFVVMEEVDTDLGEQK